MMPSMVTAHGGAWSPGLPSMEWLLVLGPVLAWLASAVLLARGGWVAAAPARGWRRPVRGYGEELARRVGLPAWCATALHALLGALALALLGFVWDVSWHIDFGRDEALFTPAHTAIVVGLAGIAGSGLLATLVATATGAEVALLRGRWRAPRCAVALVALGGGGLTGFPLDELWHRTYGIDVTMWSPTHLLMIGSAAFAPLAGVLVLAEGTVGRPVDRHLRPAWWAVWGAVLLGLSAFQLEFDFGVPQWQSLYHPVLLAIAASLALVAAREVAGPGGALAAVAVFVAVRLAVDAVLLPLGVGLPATPLYVGSAVCVEAVAALGARWDPVRRAVVAGLAVATVGTATEWGWTHPLARIHGLPGWQPGLLPWLWVAVVAAVAAAVLGVVLGRVVAGLPTARAPWLVGSAGAVVVASLALPFPRHGAQTDVTVLTTLAGDGQAEVAVQLADDRLPQGSDIFDVLAWQGGGLQRSEMVRSGSGTWTSRTAVPVSGDWKVIVRLHKRDVLAGAPVRLPADPGLGLPAVPVTDRRTVAFDEDTRLLMRESHGGSPWPARFAYLSILSVASTWLWALAWCARAVGRRRVDELDPAGRPAPVLR